MGSLCNLVPLENDLKNFLYPIFLLRRVHRLETVIPFDFYIYLLIFRFSTINKIYIFYDRFPQRKTGSSGTNIFMD